MAVDVAVEEVASNLEELAQVTRRLNTRSIGYALGGLAVGAVVGFYIGYKYNREAIKAEIFKESEAEVEKIRELYQQKTIAAEPKPEIEEIMEERGYATSVPEHERPLRAPVPGLVDPTPRAAPPVVIYEGGKDKNLNWNYPEELQNRNEDRPYIIHQDEFASKESGYDQITYTWYAGDEVMVEEGHSDPLAQTDFAVGMENLKFGHGSDDIDVVFVRNDKLELEMEICRHPGSYEEEVVGLDGNEPN